MKAFLFVAMLVGCSGQVSFNELCEEPEPIEEPSGCEADADCEAGAFCLPSARGVAINECVTLGQPGDFCEADSWCAEDLECFGHRCQEPVAECITANDCSFKYFCDGGSPSICKKWRVYGEFCKVGWCSIGLVCDMAEGDSGHCIDSCSEVAGCVAE